jgi:predicted RNA-binding Zn ribbon-like protein
MASKRSKPHFPLVAGDSCLDLVNTRIQHQDSCQEFLTSDESVSDWLDAVNLERAAKVSVGTTLELREIMRDFFESKGAEKSTQRLHAFLKQNDVTYWPEHHDHQDSFSFRARSKPLEKSGMLPVLQNFFDLCSQIQFSRLKRCENQNCSHLFYDRTKNGQRRWCSMKSCGNIMKARRFHSRHRDTD